MSSNGRKTENTSQKPLTNHLRLIFSIFSCLLWEREERQQKDEGRTAKHERVIYCLKLLSRYLGQEGVDVSWFDAIEDNRKQIGDFACYIAYIYSINAR